LQTGLACRSRRVDLAEGFEPPMAETTLAVDMRYLRDDDSPQRLPQFLARATRRRAVLRLLAAGCDVRTALTVPLQRR
jgi:hypothetical protein